MEIIILINDECRKYDIDKPDYVSDEDFTEWLFSELDQSQLTKINPLYFHNLGKLKFIRHLKCLKTV